MHTLRVLNRSGDTVATWDPQNKAATDEAQKKFDLLLGEGFTIFEAIPGSLPEGPVRTFNPKVKEYVATPRFVGG